MVRRRTALRAAVAGAACFGLMCAGLTAGRVAEASAAATVGKSAGRPADYPVALASTSGDVTGAKALVSGTGPATLSYPAGGKAPVIVLDYGTEVGGLPFFDITRISGSPVLNATYSESKQYLLPAGDGAPGTGSNADPSRTDSYPLAAAKLLVNNLVQGGERYQRITLTKPGTVTRCAVSWAGRCAAALASRSPRTTTPSRLLTR
jgi:alpha-L-rhamnosidase